MVKITLGVDGMMCNMCESRVNDAIRNAFPVKKVQSSHKDGETIIIAESPIPEEKLAAIITATGYTFRRFRSEPYEKRGLFGR